MIDFLPLIKIAPIFLVALALPGPDFFMISSLSLSRGRMAGVQAACGIAAGNFIWSTLSVCGLSMLFATWGDLLIIVRLCGGAYLLYMGYRLWKSSFEQAAGADVEGQAVKARHTRHPFVIGTLTNLTNPKAIAFFSSVFALILPPAATVATQLAILGEIALLSALWFGFVSYCLSAPAMRKAYMRWNRWIDRVAGTLMALFGIRLLTSLRN